MQICKKCGASIPDDDRYCGKCGTPVRSAGEDVKNGTAHNPYGNSTASGNNTNGNNGSASGNPYGAPYGNPYNPYNPYGAGTPYGNPYNPYNPYEQNRPSGKFHIGMLILTILVFLCLSWVAVWPFFHLCQARSAPDRYTEEDQLKKAKRALIIIFTVCAVALALLILSVTILTMTTVYS